MFSDGEQVPRPSIAQPSNNTTHKPPREGNYGGLTRKPPVLLDYLRFRLPDTTETWRWLADMFPDRQGRHRGWRGWYDQSAWILDRGVLAWCSGPAHSTEGVLIDLPGRCCAHLAATGELDPILAYALEHGAVRRVDYAIDDHDGLLQHQQLLDVIMAGQVVTRWRRIERQDNLKGAPGWTIYFGRTPHRTTMLRIYDKAAQVAPNDPCPPHWIRLELQVTGIPAHALAQQVATQGTSAVIGQIARRIRITDGCAAGSHDTDPRRWPTASWWQQLLGSTDPGQPLCPGERPATTIDALKEAIEHQAGPGLAAISNTDDWISWFYDMLARGQARLRPHHLAAISFWQAVELAGQQRKETP